MDRFKLYGVNLHMWTFWFVCYVNFCLLDYVLLVAILLVRIGLYVFGGRTAMCFGLIKPHSCGYYISRVPHPFVQTRMDKIRFFTIVCKKSDENWISIGMFVETSSTEMADEYPVFSVHLWMDTFETMPFSMQDTIVVVRVMSYHLRHDSP